MRRYLGKQRNQDKKEKKENNKLDDDDDDKNNKKKWLKYAHKKDITILNASTAMTRV